MDLKMTKEEKEKILKALDERDFDEFCKLYATSIERSHMIPDLCLGTMNMDGIKDIIKERWGVDYIHVLEINTFTAKDPTGKGHLYLAFAQRMKKEMTVKFYCRDCKTIHRLGELKHEERTHLTKKTVIHVFMCPDCGHEFKEFYEDY